MVHCSAMCSLQGFTMGRSPLLIKPTPKILGMWIHVQGPSSHIIPPSPRSTRYVHHPADSGLLLCGFNVPIKGLKWRRSEGDMSPPVVVWSEAAAAKRFWSLYCMPEWPNKEAELTISTVKLDLCKKKNVRCQTTFLDLHLRSEKVGGSTDPFDVSATNLTKASASRPAASSLVSSTLGAGTNTYIKCNKSVVCIINSIVTEISIVKLREPDRK